MWTHMYSSVSFMNQKEKSSWSDWVATAKWKVLSGIRENDSSARLPIERWANIRYRKHDSKAYVCFDALCSKSNESESPNTFSKIIVSSMTEERPTESLLLLSTNPKTMSMIYDIYEMTHNLSSLST